MVNWTFKTLPDDVRDAVVGRPARHPDSQVFYVRPGTDALQEAIDAAEAARGDILAVRPGTHTVTEAVNFNKAGIRVMAVGPTLNPLAQGEYHALLADEGYTDGPAGIITARCIIEGLGFVSRDTGATFFAGAALLIGGAAAGAFGVHLKHCRFPKWNVDNRIGLAIAGGAAVSDCLIEECSFEGVGAAFDAGIYVQGSVENLEVRRNRFRQCTYAIQHGAFAGGGPHCFYHENLCEDAKLLNADGNDATGLIAGNWVETATDTGSYDDTVDALNALGLYFAGNHYAE
jgi:hypothetical protein